MDLNKLTQKSQEAFQDAKDLALRHGNPEIDVEHMLLALLDQSQGIAPRLIQKMDIPQDALTEATEREIGKLPKQQGGAVEEGKVYVTQRLSKMLLRAQDEATTTQGRLRFR